MSEVFTEKQKEIVRVLKNDGFKRINLLEGSVRSGKTWISLVIWAFYVASGNINGKYLMCAKSLGTLKRNCLDLLQSLVGENNFCYSLSKKEAVLFEHKVYLEGASDTRAESKIRGMTLSGAYCDELTLFSEEFFTMLLSRLSDDNAKLFATTNPDNPSHWLYQKYIARCAKEQNDKNIPEGDKLSMNVYKYLIDDNTFLSDEYVSNIKREYTGVFFDRFILGRWVAAEGVCYPLFADNREKFIAKEFNPDKIQFASIGVDFGGDKSAHAFVLTGFTKNFKEIVTLDEFYLKKRISPAELEDKFIRFAKKAQEKYRVYDAYCDSAESTLIEGLKNAVYREKLPLNIRLAKKTSILDRIRFYNAIQSQGRYYILSHCVNLTEAFCTAVYDAKSLDDKRLDDGSVNIDSLDAAEYSVEPFMKDIISMQGTEL